MLNFPTAFIKFLSEQGRYSDHSVQNYARDLKKWLTFCQAQQITNWQQLQTKEIKHYLMQLKNQGISATSMRRYLSSLRLFFDYLIKQKQLKTNPAKYIKSPKIAQTLPKVLAFEEIQALITVHGTKNNQRDCLIIDLFYTSGIRLSELVGLNLDDIDFQAGFIKVLGKGNKQRYTPIGERTLVQIKQYLQGRKDNNTALFINQQQNRLSGRSVQNILAKFAKQSGLNKHLHPHMLRHSAATHFLQSSQDLRVVQDFLGHSSIKSTQRYTHLDYQHIAKVYDKSHPRAQQKTTKTSHQR